MLLVIEAAYGILEPRRILGAPDWATTVSYDIEAKVSAEDVAAFSALSRDEKLRMLQPLLAERSRLKAHIEQREIPIYQLVVVKGGPNLKEASLDDIAKRTMSNSKGKIEAVSMTLTPLLSLLNGEVGRTVVNRTGLIGIYDFKLEYTPADQIGTDESGKPSIFTALQEQLGLKLESAKAPMDVLVIDSIEKPAAN
jgi:uncharacterized protein (TIGR03435 family)